MNGLRTRLGAVSAAWPMLLDPLFAVALAAVAVTAALLSPETLGRLGSLPTAALGVACAAPVAFRRHHPLGVLAAVGTGVLAESAVGMSLNFSGFALMIAVFTVAADAPRRWSLATLVALPVYLVIADLLFSRARGAPSSMSLVDLSAGLLVFVLAWVVGDAVRVRRLRTEQLEARAAMLEAQREEMARIAVRNERAVIARELHDIVAHSVSVMVVQAGAARRVLADRPDEAAQALVSIERTGRDALGEMRRLLGILRADEAPPLLEPQQGLAGLGSLIEQSGATGMPVELVIEGEPRPLATGLDLAAFRIVQEALTNAIKHADRARALVRVRYDDDALTIEVLDDGRTSSGAGRSHAPEPGAPIAAPGGHGLVGMRERVSLYGGELSAGPRPNGGFAVRARFPLEVPAP